MGFLHLTLANKLFFHRYRQKKGSTFRRVFNLGTGTVGKICASFSRRMLYHEEMLRKIFPSLN
jgi:hypothetical protein